MVLETTIKVSTETKLKLGSLGTKKDTYDDVIKKLLELYENLKNQGI